MFYYVSCMVAHVLGDSAILKVGNECTGLWEQVYGSGVD